mmetsp:Transcript_44760/g.52459  ORF Transcript_44760/g.52459 Transcript_44760/m.52459 type:complete len:83 (-) Transcript_44760:837-1085(-)|eukprot:CAMPEP_0194420318 /NCGR_PEP_ID=MMETSP0176-20130528/19570_1 /TAXON_ID=216777 /ORGANISM="Proboscia alata, Strain PI-D3" /LENGTH=82 /DNA_ID=CAMNT_0039227837 /DNA_START=14 /DNA_END=262 /DNA_ORIENTATION=-
MTFVYTGKGSRRAQKDDAPPEQKACANQAVATQWCLAKRGQKQSLCQDFIDEWKSCRVEAIDAAAAKAAAKAADVDVDVAKK